MLSWLIFRGVVRNRPYSGQAVHFQDILCAQAQRRAWPASLRSRPTATGASSMPILGNIATCAATPHHRRYGAVGWSRLTPFVLGQDVAAEPTSVQRHLAEISARPAAVSHWPLKDRYIFKTEMDDTARIAMFPHLAKKVVLTVVDIVDLRQRSQQHADAVAERIWKAFCVVTGHPSRPSETGFQRILRAGRCALPRLSPRSTVSRAVNALVIDNDEPADLTSVRGRRCGSTRIRRGSRHRVLTREREMRYDRRTAPGVPRVYLASQPVLRDFSMSASAGVLESDVGQHRLVLYARELTRYLRHPERSPQCDIRQGRAISSKGKFGDWLEGEPDARNHGRDCRP